MRRRRVSLTQPLLPAYRHALFQLVVDELAADNIELRLFHLTTASEKIEQGESVSAPWSYTVPGSFWRSRVGDFLYRRLPVEWSKPDMLVTELAAGNLNAWAALVKRQPFILFGHGSSGTTGHSAAGQRLENRIIRGAQHTLTYSPKGAAAVRIATSVKEDRVTPFHNSIDTVALRARRQAMTRSDVESFALSHGLQVDAPTILSVGRLDTVKRLDLLIETVLECRRRLPTLQVIVGGRGPMEESIRALAAAQPWVVWLGRMGPGELAAASHLGFLLLNPGRIGLVAVDALALNLLVVTAEGSSHAPEIEYLLPGTELLEAGADATALSHVILTALASGRRPAERPLDTIPTVERAAGTIARCIIDALAPA